MLIKGEKGERELTKRVENYYFIYILKLKQRNVKDMG